MKTRLQKHRTKETHDLRGIALTRVDIVAFLAFAALWIYYFVIARYGVCYPDEFAYISFAERFMHGERPLVDEWNTAQIASLLLCPLCRLYVALKGSFSGIILFMRCLFVAFNGVFYWYMYFHLRAYRWHAWIAAVLFCAYIPGGLFACNYYTVPVRLLMIVCLVMFEDRQKPLPLLAAGILFAASVLMQPGLMILYLVYTALVWIRFFHKKNEKHFLEDYAFCLRLRTWKYFSFISLICAAAFFVWLAARSGLHSILEYIPLVFTDPEYNYSAHGSAWIIFFRKLAVCIRIYGLVCLIPALILLVLSVVCAYRKNGAQRVHVRKILFTAACLLWILSCLLPFRLQPDSIPDILFKVYPAPMLWFGLVCYLLCERKNKRFFFFWVVALVSSLCIDLFSEVAVSVCVPISFIADLLFFTDLIREFRAEAPAKKITSMTQLRSSRRKKAFNVFVRGISRLTCVCFAVYCALVVLIENPIVPEHFIRGTPLSSFSVLCETGPCQSIRYPQAYAQDYKNKLSDMDTIKKTCPHNLFVFGMSPELYLYAELPYASYTCWTWRYMPNLIGRHVQFWKMQPERFPECVYVPFFEPNHPLREDDDLPAEALRQIRENLDPICTYTMETGKAGYILHVSQWHLDAQASAQSS